MSLSLLSSLNYRLAIFNKNFDCQTFIMFFYNWNFANSWHFQFSNATFFKNSTIIAKEILTKCSPLNVFLLSFAKNYEHMWILAMLFMQLLLYVKLCMVLLVYVINKYCAILYCHFTIHQKNLKLNSILFPPRVM